MFRWAGRSVTGTRVGTVCCFPLFALVSVSYEVATACSIGLEGLKLVGTVRCFSLFAFVSMSIKLLQSVSL